MSANYVEKLTDAEIKTAYENNPDTNEFNDTEKTKLSNIQAGAEVNIQSDWTQVNDLLADYIKNKPSTFPPSIHNHDDRYYTETESDAQLFLKLDASEKGDANGVAPVVSGKIPISFIPTEVQDCVKVVGNWDADTNDPDLSALTPPNGNAYIVTVAGNTNLNGETNWKLKDLAVYYSTTGWFKLDNTDDVLLTLRALQRAQAGAEQATRASGELPASVRRAQERALRGVPQELHARKEAPGDDDC